MKITDVVTLMEFGFGPPGSRAMGTGNFALLHRAYVNKRPRLSRNLQLDFGNNQVIDQKNQQVSRQHRKLSQASTGTVSTQPLHTSTVSARQSRAVAPVPELEPDQIAELVAIELEAGEPPPVLTGLASAIAKSKTSNTKTKSNSGENSDDSQSSL